MGGVKTSVYVGKYSLKWLERLIEQHCDRLVEGLEIYVLPRYNHHKCNILFPILRFSGEILCGMKNFN